MPEAAGSGAPAPRLIHRDIAGRLSGDDFGGNRRAASRLETTAHRRSNSFIPPTSTSIRRCARSRCANRRLPRLIGGATRRAFAAVIDLCLAEQVDALLIAGDLYDGEQTSMKTARFLADQFRRLHEAGIAAFIIRGNHDANRASPAS